MCNMSYKEHPDREVRESLIRLTDALCMYERKTGKRNVLILKQSDGFGEGGYHFRALDGKPGIPNEITDEALLKIVDY